MDTCPEISLWDDNGNDNEIWKDYPLFILSIHSVVQRIASGTLWRTVSQERVKGIVLNRMIILITGASHTGKTALAQKLLEKYKYPYLSIDHLKMGLIRSGNTMLTPVSDESALTNYLWQIVSEMIKTVIENEQNLIVEGCYIPFDWSKDFEPGYLNNIKYYCLVMSEKYINNHFNDIKKYANIVEKRINDEDCTIETVRRDNAEILKQCQYYKVDYILIDEEYQTDIDILLNGR